MAAPVTTLQLLHDGARNVVVKATFLSGGLDQPVSPFVTVAALNPNPGATLKVTKVHYNIIPGGTVRLYWDSPPTPTDMMDLTGFGFDDYRSFGGITNNGGPDATGNILISTQGFTLGYQYTITLEMIKGV